MFFCNARFLQEETPLQLRFHFPSNLAPLQADTPWQTAEHDCPSSVQVADKPLQEDTPLHVIGCIISLMVTSLQEDIPSQAICHLP